MVIVTDSIIQQWYGPLTINIKEALSITLTSRQNTVDDAMTRLSAWLAHDQHISHLPKTRNVEGRECDSNLSTSSKKGMARPSSIQTVA